MLVGEDGVGLDQLFGEVVTHVLHDVAAHAAAGASRDGVRDHEALEGVGALGLPEDHVEDLLLVRVALVEAGSPVVACAASFLAHPDVFRVVKVALFGAHDVVDDPGLEVKHDGPGDILVGVGLVEKHVLTVVDELVGLEQLADGREAVFGAELFPKFVSYLIAALADL